MASLLYTAGLDLVEADVEPFLRWYAFRHAPDLFPIGFRSCASYRALEGDMNLFDVYEIPSTAIFDDPRYLAMGPRDPYAAGILEKRRGKAHTVYAQRRITPSAPGEDPPIDADWISVLRFDAPAGALDQIADALTGGSSLLTRRNAQRVRVAERTTDHPRYTTFRPRCMVLVEWPERPPAEASPRTLMAPSAGAALSNVSTFVGSRLYPWPDRPAQAG